MLQRFTSFLILLVVVLSSVAHAQDQQPADPEQAMRDQMRGVFQTVMQNMVEKGIDPQQFFRQLQNGTDPAEIKKQLVDQGLIDQKTLDDLQTNMQSLLASSIKRQLGVTDEEWTALWPLIQNVMTASAAVNGTRGGGRMGMGGFLTSQVPTGTELAKATRALHDVLKDPAANAEQFKAVLKDYRDARAKSQAELDAARRDLTTVLTVRQEAVLTTMGILE